MNTGKKALQGTIFVAANSYLSMLIYFVAGIVLTRTLTPTDFGVYRLSLFFVDLFGRVKEFGLDKALIHRQDNLEKAYRSHFTLQMLLSVLVLFTAIAFSPLLLKQYSGEIYSYVILISIAYIFQSLGSTQRVILEKNLLFQHTAAVEIVSLFLSSVISIIMAFKGFGPLSLVAGYGLNFIFSSIAYWVMRPWKPSLSDLILFEKGEIFWFAKFGVFLFLGGITTFILYKYNDFVLGTFLSLAALGLYSRAFNYAQIPTSLVTSVISKVALPTYSTVQNDAQKLTDGFSIVLKSIIRVSFPLSLVLYLVADDFTVFILGPNWSPMVPIFRILLIYGVLRSIFDDLGELFTAVGRPKYVSFYLFIQALTSLILAPLLVGIYKAEGAALSLSVVMVLGVILAYFFVGKIVRVNLVEIAAPTFLVCALSYFSFRFIINYLNPSFANPLLSLVTKGLVFAPIYLVFELLIDGRAFARDLYFIVGHLRLKDVPVEKLEEIEAETVSRRI